MHVQGFSQLLMIFDQIIDGSMARVTSLAVMAAKAMGGPHEHHNDEICGTDRGWLQVVVPQLLR